MSSCGPAIATVVPSAVAQRLMQPVLDEGEVMAAGAALPVADEFTAFDTLDAALIALPVKK
jgi:hypothetical protein